MRKGSSRGDAEDAEFEPLDAFLTNALSLRDLLLQDILAALRAATRLLCHNAQESPGFSGSRKRLELRVLRGSA